jgi:hypothetical protein
MDRAIQLNQHFTQELLEISDYLCGIFIVFFGFANFFVR